MKAIFRLTGMLLLSLATIHAQQPSPATTQRGTVAEAKNMLDKAVEHYKSVGRTQALADFNAKKAPFGDRDLYVFCITRDLTIAANGGFPQYVGMHGNILKDAEGKPLAKAFWDAAANKDEGSITYPMINPISGNMERKVAFWKKIGDDICGVGAYNPQ